MLDDDEPAVPLASTPPTAEVPLGPAPPEDVEGPPVSVPPDEVEAEAPLGPAPLEVDEPEIPLGPAPSSLAVVEETILCFINFLSILKIDDLSLRIPGCC